jgi:hypothetical protein
MNSYIKLTYKGQKTSKRMFFKTMAEAKQNANILKDINKKVKQADSMGKRWGMKEISSLYYFSTSSQSLVKII